MSIKQYLRKSYLWLSDEIQILELTLKKASYDKQTK